VVIGRIGAGMADIRRRCDDAGAERNSPGWRSVRVSSIDPVAREILIL